MFVTIMFFNNRWRAHHRQAARGFRSRDLERGLLQKLRRVGYFCGHVVRGREGQGCVPGKATARELPKRIRMIWYKNMDHVKNGGNQLIKIKGFWTEGDGVQDREGSSANGTQGRPR